MKMTYRTKRRLRSLGLTALIVTVVLLAVWFCSVIWLERFVVYSSEGAKLDFEVDPAGFAGVEAVKPEAQGGVSIFYNEGSDAVSISKELTPINGYYLDYAAMVKDMAGAFENLDVVPAGTPILIDMKGGYGTFYYSSTIAGAVPSASAPVQSVDEFVKKLRTKGYYMIARVSAFQDYMYGNANVPSGLYMQSRAGLWMDDEGCYWLDPASAGVQSWITSAVLELKNMGFHEVVLANFQFPNSDKYLYDKDKTEALQNAMQNLLTSTASAKGTFTLSFGTNDPTLTLPEGARSRIYLQQVDAKDVDTSVEKTTVPDRASQVVFLATTNDTRFDKYSVLRPLGAAKTLEAQKAAAAAAAEATE